MDDIDLGATIKGFATGQKVFGRYTLKRILGRGGMGVVWLARDDKLERDVALKFLPEVMMGDKLALADLKRETRRSLDLTHSHIVRIYDFVEDGRTAAIAMEYISGETLTNARANRAGHCYEPADIAKWVGQICDALDYAHTKARVVHRDLKPANLMIDAAGDVKVTDFGIATSIADSVSRVSKQAGSSGTPVYMSPQQMMGEKPAVTDDIYALGATLYDLLSGKPPFHSGNIILQVQSKMPPSIAERRRELEKPVGAIPPEWEQTIAACLAKEPRARPQSAGEIAERLGITPKGTKQRTEDNVEPGSRPDSPRVETLRTTSKTPLYAGIAASVIVLGGLGWYFGLHAPEQRRLAEIARLENERRTEEANRLRTEREKADAEARRKIQLAEAAAKAETERLANARGGLVVRTTPAGAEVRVGAIALDKSPLTLKEQKLGKYPVHIHLDGYEDWSGEMEVIENEFKDYDVSLVRSTGKLTLGSDPAGVDVNVVQRVISLGVSDQISGKTVRTPGELSLGTGIYDLIFRRTGWPEQKQTVEVVRNQTASVKVKFAAGGLELTSSPSGAEVWRYGEKLGVTPYHTEEMIPGQYVFELKLNDYWPTSVDLTITGGETKEKFVKLGRYFPKWGKPWENSLGMKFVSVPERKCLISIWDTRVQDYQVFVNETGREWPKPSFEQGPTHPAVNVSQNDARDFCKWLTEKERSAGRLGKNQRYTLPEDAHWSLAVGLDEINKTASGSENNEKISGVYPWGTQWPPPAGAGNFSDETRKNQSSGPDINTIPGYDDGFAYTSPVGRFAPNKLGLYDMSGNVWQICYDIYDSLDLRGGSFRTSKALDLLSSHRTMVGEMESAADKRYDHVGFRCVINVIYDD